MTRAKPVDPDAITLLQAARLLGMSEVSVTRFRREGLLVRLPGHPSYSRSDVEAFRDNPWINGRQAAEVLGVSRARVSELARDGRLPTHLTASGRRMYRLRQLEVVANARDVRFHQAPLGTVRGLR